MAFVNYDLLKGEDDSIYMYLSSSFFWINKPGSSESRARTSLPKGMSYKKFGSLRDVAQEVFTMGVPKYKRTVPMYGITF